MGNEAPSFLFDDPVFRDVGADIAAGISSWSPPYISIENDRFTLVDAKGDKEEAGSYDKNIGFFLDVVIVDTNRHVSKVYYEDKYVPGQTSYNPPNCYSDNGLAPSSGAARPMSPTCATCPLGAWGQGNTPPACRSYKKIAVFVIGEDGNLIMGGANGDVPMLFLLRVPPNSLSNKELGDRSLSAYVNKVGKQAVPQGQRKLNVTDVVTRIVFSKTDKGTLEFGAKRYINPDIRALQVAAWNDNAADDMVGRYDQPISEEVRLQLAAGSPSPSGPQAGGKAAAGTSPGAPAAATGSIADRAMGVRGPDTNGAKRATSPGRPPRAAAKPKAIAAKPAVDDGLPDHLRRAKPAAEDLDQKLYTRDTEAEAENEAAEARGAFGVVDNAAEPPSETEAALEELFG